MLTPRTPGRFLFDDGRLYSEGRIASLTGLFPCGIRALHSVTRVMMNIPTSHASSPPLLSEMSSSKKEVTHESVFASSSSEEETNETELWIVGGDGSIRTLWERDDALLEMVSLSLSLSHTHTHYTHTFYPYVHLVTIRFVCFHMLRCRVVQIPARARSKSRTPNQLNSSFFPPIDDSQ